jgi:hypothetical protein
VKQSTLDAFGRATNTLRWTLEAHRRLEAAGWSVAPGNATTIDRVLSVLERKGVEFVELGVRLTKQPRRRDGA